MGGYATLGNLYQRSIRVNEGGSGGGRREGERGAGEEEEERGKREGVRGRGRGRRREGMMEGGSEISITKCVGPIYRRGGPAPSPSPAAIAPPSHPTATAAAAPSLPWTERCHAGREGGLTLARELRGFEFKLCFQLLFSLVRAFSLSRILTPPPAPPSRQAGDGLHPTLLIRVARGGPDPFGERAGSLRSEPRVNPASTPRSPS